MSDNFQKATRAKTNQQKAFAHLTAQMLGLILCGTCLHIYPQYNHRRGTIKKVKKPKTSTKTVLTWRLGSVKRKENWRLSV